MEVEGDIHYVALNNHAIDDLVGGLDNSYPRQLVPRTTRIQDNSYPRQLGYELSWVRVVLGTICPGCELSIIHLAALAITWLTTTLFTNYLYHRA